MSLNLPLEISLRRFMSHEETDLTLPATGLVLVTGSNGAGKSSLVEAVSYAAFGKTLRGTSPFSEPLKDARANVSVFGNLHLERSPGKVRWQQSCYEKADEDTPTKAQERLEAVVGTWDAWRRTRVFSSADAAHFSSATDAERKRLLESVLGLARFDDALASCRADRREAGLRGSEYCRDQELAQAAVDAAARRRLDARKQLDAMGPKESMDVLRQTVANLGAAEKAARAAREEAQRRAAVVVRESGQREGVREAARSRLERLGRGECPECGQGLPGGLLASLGDALRHAEEECAASQASADEAAKQVLDLAEEHDSLRRSRVAVEKKLAEAERLQPAAEAATAVMTAAHADAEAARKKVLAAFAGWQLEEKRAQLLGCVETVLGLRGVRAHVLDKALAGVEVMANRWLSKLEAPLRVALKSSTERQSGKVVDAISLEVGVAPSASEAFARLGGVPLQHGYRAASSGQRRRVDVALLLALSEVASAANPSPLNQALWLDEIFDAVDAEGTPAVARCLRELAEDKLVVVITHSEGLKASLQPDQHLHVEDGKVRRV